MNIAINDEILNNHGLSLSEFACILYYLDENTDILNKELCEKVWEKGFLIKVVDGFKIDNNKFSEIETMVAKATVVQSKGDRLLNLANALREIFPGGKKPGTNYYWRDNPNIIAQRLSIFLKKYGDTYTDEQIINAAKRYVESFNGNYQFMQLLKYFISKQNKQTGEPNSELASYLANEGQEGLRNDWDLELK